MPGQEKSFLVYAKRGEIGFKVDSNLDVILVQKGSMADGKVYIGDKLVRVNTQVIITKPQFEKAVQSHAGQGVTIVVWHDNEKVQALKPDMRKAGFEIKEICIVWNPISQQKLGLAVKGEGPNVFITNVPENSVCSMYLREGDRLLSVDGWPIIDKEMTRNFLVNAFRFNNRVTLHVERPVDDEAVSSVSNVITAASNQDPSVFMQSDVLDIMQKQMKKLEQNDDPKLKCVYKSKDDTSGSNNKKKSDNDNSTNENKKHVQIKSQIKQTIIGQDNSSMADLLKPVPPRGPNFQQ